MPHHDEYAYNPGDIAYLQGQDLKKAVIQLAARVEKLEKELQELKAEWYRMAGQEVK